MKHTLRFLGTSTYRPFIDEITLAIKDPDKHDLRPILNGRAGTRCIELLPASILKSMGAYFTPLPIATTLAARLPGFDPSTSVALDPSCGAGDLLLPLASKLPVKTTVSQTLIAWNERLSGLDISPEFVLAARLRLLLLAIARGARLDGTHSQLAKHLCHISVGNGLSAILPYERATHIVMNPPFGITSAPPTTEWRNGRVTTAALFLDRAIDLCNPGTRIAAILPEVLRTGTSYQRWRDCVARRSSSRKTHSLGQFSSDADIDVFLKLITVGAAPYSQLATANHRRRHSLTIGDKFRVRVGPVVPHRHILEGPCFAFLHAGNATAWRTIKRINERRRYQGTLLTPPFVVIRRTSRPGDSHRAIASLVLGSRPVAVENHLLVAIPRRGGIPICQSLLRLLQSDAVNKALNRTMRCRHLTTASVSGLAWP